MERRQNSATFVPHVVTYMVPNHMEYRTCHLCTARCTTRDTKGGVELSKSYTALYSIERGLRDVCLDVAERCSVGKLLANFVPHRLSYKSYSETSATTRHRYFSHLCPTAHKLRLALRTLFYFLTLGEVKMYIDAVKSGVITRGS